MRTTKSRSTLYRPSYTIRSMKFKFRIDDDDNWPSVPHGHASKDGDNFVIELWTGNIYRKENRHFWKKAKQQEIDNLRTDEKLSAFVTACRNAYKKRHPEMTLPDLEGGPEDARKFIRAWRRKMPRVITIMIQTEE